MRVFFVLNLFFFFSFHSFSYDLEDCKSRGWKGTTIPFTNSGKFIPECAPDTLFTWQDWGTINEWAKNSTKDNLLPLTEDTYFWRTPAGTFAYGDMAVRTKLKPNVEFKLISPNDRDCDLLNQKYGEKPVVYVVHLHWMNASEYVLCNSEAVDSWSYGTEKHLHEIKSEVKFIECQNGEYESVDRYVNPSDPDEFVHRVSKFGFTVDSLPFLPFPGLASTWTNRTLKRHIRNVEKIIEKSRGNIFESEDAKKSGRDHFKTETGYYFEMKEFSEEESN